MPTITLDQADPRLGALVTFTVRDVPKKIKNARIEVQAFQDGVLVYGEAGSADQGKQQELTGVPGFILGGAPAIPPFSGGSIWANVGGPAECVARLFYYDNHGPTQQYVALAETSFAAGGA